MGTRAIGYDRALVIAEFGDHFGDFDVGELAARKDGMNGERAA